ncbi:hypothetical protein M409DRAFT_49921 [Zasmidium cellare ATCC 36951]|uniref:Uncharacterized protein n=1 Tax=Zasmidium cellare ATCC 36951 TaxID=1080233 RepID=A0A6A6D266_ZASCE|nr:uncharacterized protein M409DRAFT_49921 [Zasmidium cellare ATCC 36951]KAF2172189.1 hypothetical protein M409DRAFT_49921 [Zasmidium cellare ATCC 36951]
MPCSPRLLMSLLVPWSYPEELAFSSFRGVLTGGGCIQPWSIHHIPTISPPSLAFESRMNSTLHTMPFLNADDHILHQDSLALEGSTTYWTDMETHQHHQALLDPSYLDPETVMHASEALMRLSEQDLNIEPTLRSLHVDDTATANYAASNNDFNPPEIDYATHAGPGHVDANDVQQHQLPPREPWDAAKIRLWREQFGLANVHAGRWSGTGAGTAEGSGHRSTGSRARKTSTVSKAGSASTGGVARRALSKVA